MYRTNFLLLVLIMCGPLYTQDSKCQGLDSLQTLVLSNTIVDVSADCKGEYLLIQKEVKEGKYALQINKYGEKQIQIDTNIKLDDYTKRLIQNEVAFKKFTGERILKKANPRNLDLRRQQLFIDTTRNSRFYQRISARKDWEIDVKDYVRKSIFKRFPIRTFPRKWVSLRKLNGNFVLYDRCDGIDRRFQITDSTVNIFGPLENEVQVINRVLSQSSKDITIECKSGNILSIRQTSIRHVYRLQYDDENYFVTPASSIHEFDLVVNHCPTEKIPEFKMFDE